MEIEKVKGKVLEEKPGFPGQYGPARTDHQPGSPFSPHEIYRDLVIIFVMVGITFFLAAVATPPLGAVAPPRGVTVETVPDWYVLWSWGLLQVARVLPSFVLPGDVLLNPALWGDLLSGIPILALLLLPFIDRGRESRPAKAPVRSAFGIAGIFFVFGATLYSVGWLITPRWRFISDLALQGFFVVPPLLGGVATYVGLRRLAFRPMRLSILVVTGAASLVFLIDALLTFWWSTGNSLETQFSTLKNLEVQILGLFILILFDLAFVPFLAPFFLGERRARRTVLVTAYSGLLLLTAIGAYFNRTSPGSIELSLAILGNHMHTFIALPIFATITAYVGLREPYSMYEYLLNECYQCGKCHTVCPVTKVEDDALGGLNLVYNTFKKQHDGVPLWTCLACDACSAVCPLDIKYSDYILEERARALSRPLAADGGEVVNR